MVADPADKDFRPLVGTQLGNWLLMEEKGQYNTSV